MQSHISARVPGQLHDAVAARAAERELPLSTVVREAVARDVLAPMTPRDAEFVRAWLAGLDAPESAEVGNV